MKIEEAKRLLRKRLAATAKAKAKPVRRFEAEGLHVVTLDEAVAGIRDGASVLATEDVIWPKRRRASYSLVYGFLTLDRLRAVLGKATKIERECANNRLKLVAWCRDKIYLRTEVT